MTHSSFSERRDAHSNVTVTVKCLRQFHTNIYGHNTVTLSSGHCWLCTGAMIASCLHQCMCQPIKVDYN